jgi:putative flippase GtrA
VERAGHAHSGWRVVVRHQLGAAAGTLVDFAVMIATVHAGLSPTAGTAVGASAGAVTNFALARHWIFPAGVRVRAQRQAIRYAFVSLVSLGLNTLGEHVVHDLLRVEFVLARALVALAVGLAWNFPLHRAWVFAPAATARTEPPQSNALDASPRLDGTELRRLGDGVG